MSITATITDIAISQGIIKVQVNYDDTDSRVYTYGSDISFDQIVNDISQSLRAKVNFIFRQSEMKQYIGLSLTLDKDGDPIKIVPPKI